MSTVKSIITKNVPTTLTAAYTNTSGGNAILKAVNINGIADNTSMQTATEGSEWSFFGTNNPVFATSSSDVHGGTPLSVKLSTDRILNIWTPHHTHVGAGVDWLGNSVVHCQILEWQTDRYVAGPITNVTLPTAVFSSITNGLFTPPGSAATATSYSTKLVALTATKVALIYRIGTSFRAVRLSITGNAVDPTSSANYDLTQAASFNTTTAAPFDATRVPGDTNKVIIAGSNGSTWITQVLTVPDSAAITGSSVFNTGITATSYYCTIAHLNRTAVANVVTYVLAATSSTNTVISVQNISLNITNDAMSNIGTAATKTAVTAFQGVQAECLSSDGTANAVIVYADTGGYANVYSLFQNSLSQAQVITTTTNLGTHSSARGISEGFEWGNSKAVFVGYGNTIVMCNSAGTVTNLAPATLSTSSANTGVQLWFPFDTRPLYPVFDASNLTGNKIAQYYARTGATSTDAGTLDQNNTYLPYGHNYGGHYGWSEQAQCWFVGYGGKIYALSTTGKVLNELNLTYLNINIQSTFAVKLLTVTKSGKVLFITHQQGAHPSFYYGIYWNSITATAYAGGLQTLNSFTELTSKPTLLSPVTNLSTSHCLADIVSFTDSNGIDRAYALAAYSDGTNMNMYIGRFDGATWSNYTTLSVTTAAISSSFHYGNRPNWRIIQDTPADMANQLGLFRLVGGQSLASAAAMSRNYTSSVPYSEASFSSLNCSTALGTTTPTYGYGKAVSQSLQVLYTYNAQYSSIQFHTVYNGRLLQGPLGTLQASSTSAQFINGAVGKEVYTLGTCNTSNTLIAQQTFVYDSNVFATTPRVTLTATTGTGWTATYPMDQTKVQVFASGINNSYNIASPNDSARVYLAINDGTNDFFMTPNVGQTVRNNASFRTNDTYLIPNGGSVKIRSSLSNSLDSLLSIVEEA